jgi:tetratricopeptide (TPR) repeat protein
VVALGIGDVDTATSHAEKALRRVELLGLPFWIARSHMTLGACHFGAGRFDSARTELLSALQRLDESSSAAGSVHWRLARVARLEGRLDEARERLVAARAVLEGEELEALTEVLAMLIEEAILASDTDPERAARLLARVERDRGPSVCAFGVDDDVAPLLSGLRSRLGDERLEEIVVEVTALPPWTPSERCP